MISKKVFNWLEAVALGVVIVLASAVISHRMDKPSLIQADALGIQNGSLNVGANALTQIFTPSQNGAVRIYSLSAWCGTASTTGAMFAFDIDPANSNPTIWTNHAGDISVNLVSYYWPQPLVGEVGKPVQISVTNCTGNSTTLNWQVAVN